MLKVIAPGSECLLQTGTGNKIIATITQVSVGLHNRIMYELTYWIKDTHWIKWHEEFEVEGCTKSKTVDIGWLHPIKEQ